MGGGNFVKNIIIFSINNEGTRFNLGSARFKSLTFRRTYNIN